MSCAVSPGAETVASERERERERERRGDLRAYQRCVLHLMHGLERERERERDAGMYSRLVTAGMVIPHAGIDSRPRLGTGGPIHVQANVGTFRPPQK